MHIVVVDFKIAAFLNQKPLQWLAVIGASCAVVVLSLAWPVVMVVAVLFVKKIVSKVYKKKKKAYLTRDASACRAPAVIYLLHARGL